MKMRKGIFSLLFCTFVFLSLPVLAQQSTLLENIGLWHWTIITI